MARIDRGVTENVPGEFYVDDTCIDCATCRQIAPATFGDAHGHSFVHRQPSDDAATLRATMALVSCPTSSIGTRSGLDITRAVAQFPNLVEENVHYCGFTASSSYGAWSYLIVREDGNVLVDCPRWNGGLVKRIESLGGVRFMFLTHQDDVADHERYAAHFKCERLLHEGDARGALGRAVERKLTGSDDIVLADDLRIIPTPGHTRGHCVLLHREKFLFTGDHLWWDDDEKRLAASRSVCWHSWPEQVKSVEKLRGYAFQWVLPGHGHWHRAESSAVMREQLDACARRLSAAV